MNELISTQIYCPYCGEPLLVMIEPIGEDQQYTEDCQVCCRPMVFHVTEEGGQPQLEVRSEDDTW